MPTSAPRTTESRAFGVAWALIAAGLASALPGPGAVSAGQSVTIDIGAPPPNLVAPDQLIGDWLTIVLSDGKPQPVRLILHKVEPGKTAGKLIYSSPRRCIVDLEYGGPDEDRHIFYMIPFTNCFKYQKTDYVAIWTTAPAPAAPVPAVPVPAEPIPAEPAPQPSDASDQSDYFGLNARQKAAKDDAATDAAPSDISLVPPIQEVERVRYSVIVNDQPTESGLLTKQ